MNIKNAFSNAMQDPQTRLSFIIMVAGCIGAFVIPVLLKGNTKIMTVVLLVDAFVTYIKGNQFSTKFTFYVAAEQEKKQ